MLPTNTSTSLVRTVFLSAVVMLSALAGPKTSAQRNDSTKPALSGVSESMREILDEQDEIRRELNALKLQSELFRRRLNKLDRLSILQMQLDELVISAETANEKNRNRDGESRIDFLERQIARLRVAMETETELTHRIIETSELKQRLHELPASGIMTRLSRTLTDSIENISRLRQLHIDLDTGEDLPQKIRAQIEDEIDDLQEQVDFDSECTELAFRLVESNRENRAQELNELRSELRDLLQEMEHRSDRSLGHSQHRGRPDQSRNSEDPRIGTSGQPGFAPREGVVESGQYFIRQSWSQERDFPRPFFVNVPNGKTDSKYPVLIFLHGNGGNARDAMRNMLRNRKAIASRYVMVFAQGYQESWNIVSERSKADDTAFIESIVLKLAECVNIKKDDFSVMGASNGAALVNQLMIESRLPHFRNFISGVSPLNAWQHDGTHFKARGDGNDYRQPAKPATGRRLMNISGTNDRLVPYNGGFSPHIPAKGGKLAFLSAEESTYLWAKQMGETAKQLTIPSRTQGQIEFFSYLGGDVVHCKVTGAGHGATHEVSEDELLRFLQNGAKKQKTASQP